jgi:REP element-mobilizing transposase RayT
MARPLRLEFPGALYHVTARGDGREDIFLSDDDRRLFLDVLGNVWERFNWRVHAYCLMTNHYHLLVETPEANLAKGMRQLNGVYTQRFNRFHDRVGHVFQGRYRSILVQKERHLLELARYVVLNPVRARLATDPEDWPWSSYRATTGRESPPDWLDRVTVLAAFGSTEGEAIAHYIRFVADGKGQPSPWGQLKHQIFLGSDRFVESARKRIPEGIDLEQVPQARAREAAKPLAEYARQHPERDAAIAAAYESGGYTLRELGEYFGLHYSRVSKVVQAARQAKRKKSRPDPHKG